VTQNAHHLSGLSRPILDVHSSLLFRAYLVAGSVATLSPYDPRNLTQIYPAFPECRHSPQTLTCRFLLPLAFLSVAHAKVVSTLALNASSQLYIQFYLSKSVLCGLVLNYNYFERHHPSCYLQEGVGWYAAGMHSEY
jgi:hypothetical protein